MTDRGQVSSLPPHRPMPVPEIPPSPEDRMCSQADDPTQYDGVPGTAVADDQPADRSGDPGARGVPGEVEPEGEVPPFATSPPIGVSFASRDRTGAYIFLSKDDLGRLNGLLNDLQVIDRFFGNEETITPDWRLHLHISVADALLKLDEA